MSYDYRTNILSGASVPQLFHSNTSVGQVIIHYLLRDASRIIQTNFDDGVELSAGKIAKLGSIAAANLSTLITFPRSFSAALLPATRCRLVIQLTIRKRLRTFSSKQSLSSSFVITAITLKC